MWAYFHKVYLYVADSVYDLLRTSESHDPQRLGDRTPASRTDEDMPRDPSSSTDRTRWGAVRERRPRRTADELVLDLVEAQEENSSLKKLLDTLKVEHCGLIKTHEELLGKLKSSAEAAEHAKLENRSLQEHIGQQQRSIAESQKAAVELTQTKRELEVCRRERRDIEALLQVRTAELRDAQQYLGKSDTASYADVKRMVEALNSQIFQMAAQVVDTFPFEEARSQVLSTQLARRRDFVGTFVGLELARVVAISSHSVDPMLVQVIIQAYLVRRASDTINTWAIGIPSAHNKMLHEINGRILSNETQAVSARWRTLTRRYISSSANDQRKHEAETCKSFVHDLFRILSISGIASLERPETVMAKVHAVVDEKVTAIVNKALEIRRLVGEEITTTEFRVFCPQEGDSFLADYMADMDDSGPGNRSAMAAHRQTVVLCTTELGLYRHGKRRSPNADEEVWETNVLLKAKVALPSLLEDCATEPNMGRAVDNVELE
ncbi:hypothetical protein BC629DRAFT_1591006 [Irpex lacteus]|nr:hypothetical protein BC629DRAFT_1591006 [Irpex lacteus]